MIESIEPHDREKIESVEISAPKEPLAQEPTVSIEPKDKVERKELHELHVREKIVSTGIITVIVPEDTPHHAPLEQKKLVRLVLREATELHVCVIIVPVQQAIHPIVQEAVNLVVILPVAGIHHILAAEVVEVIHPEEVVIAEVLIRHLAVQEVHPVIAVVVEAGAPVEEEVVDKKI